MIQRLENLAGYSRENEFGFNPAFIAVLKFTHGIGYGRNIWSQARFI